MPREREGEHRNLITTQIVLNTTHCFTVLLKHDSLKRIWRLTEAKGVTPIGVPIQMWHSH